MLLAVSYVLLCTAITAVALRLYVKLGLRNGVRSDDYTVVASLVSPNFEKTSLVGAPSLTVFQIAAIIGVGCETKFVLTGLGRHIYCLPPEQMLSVIKWSVISQIFNVIGIGLAKISVCLCVLRIIGWTRKYLATFLWVVIAFCAASHSAQVLLFLLQCRPMAAMWDPRIRGGKCFSPHITYLAGYIGFGLDAFTDLVCAAIPILILRGLQMNARTKTALCVVIGLGSLTAACAVAKAVTLQDGVFAYDFTWGLWKPAVCTIVEHLAGLTLVSLPALRPFFTRVLDVAAIRGGGSSGRRSSAPPHQRGPRRTTPAVSNDTYAFEKSLRSDEDPEPTSGGGIAMGGENGIVRTTEFRLSEHTSEIGVRCLEEEDQEQDLWPLPPSPVYATYYRSDNNNAC